MMESKVLLVGEDYFLTDEMPDGSIAPASQAEERLCRAFGMYQDIFLLSFLRVNIVLGRKWAGRRVVAAASWVRECTPSETKVILLGKRVWGAWFPGLPWLRFIRRPDFITLPSAYARAWREPDTVTRARAAVLELAPWLAGKVGQND